MNIMVRNLDKAALEVYSKLKDYGIPVECMTYNNEYVLYLNKGNYKEISVFPVSVVLVKARDAGDDLYRSDEDEEIGKGILIKNNDSLSYFTMFAIYDMKKNPPKTWMLTEKDLDSDSKILAPWLVEVSNEEGVKSFKLLLSKEYLKQNT